MVCEIEWISGGNIHDTVETTNTWFNHAMTG
jgi:hypothetical protein